MLDESALDDGGVTLLAQGAMSALRDMQRALGAHGIASEMMRPPAKDGACAPGGG